MKQKIILVVGGAGYIGSHVNKMLNQAGYKTVVLDNLSKGDSRSVIKGTFVQGDMGKEEDLDKIFTTYPIDAVFHFAAFTDVGESVEHPYNYYKNNLCNTLNLLNAMLRYQIKTFIFSSTAAIFGEPQAKKIEEDHPCHPINPYGQSKLMVENILKDFDKAYGIKFCALRYFNAAGGDPDGELKNYQKKSNNLIPIVLNCIKNDKPVTIFGTDYPTLDGTCIRDYIHIWDLGNAHITAMEELWNGAPSNFYNLGNGEGYSVREVIHAAERVTRHSVELIEGRRRPGDPPILIADATKARVDLRWEIRYPRLEEMIEHAWNAIP